MDLFVGHAEDDRAPVGEGHHETLVLELPERLADRAAARAELRRERRLDQALAGLEAAGDDRGPEELDHLLAPRAGLRTRLGDSEPARPAGPASDGVWSGHVDNLKMVDNLGSARRSVSMSVRITKIETIAVRTPMREPLVWPGGTRHSASGLLVQIHTDEGLVGVGEAPGPTLPTIQTIIDAELTQFLVGQDPLRVEWLVHRMEEFTRNWSRIGAYAIAGIEMALLDLKGKALGVPVAELLGGFCRDRVAGRRLPLHRLAGGERAEGGRLRRRRLHRAEAQGRARLRAGSRHARRDPRPRRAGREDPDRREHDLERPGGDQVDQGARALRPPVRRAAGAGLRRAGPGAGAPLRRGPDRRGRGVHRPALRARADQGGRLRRVRRLSVGGRRPADGRTRSARSPTRPASGA